MTLHDEALAARIRQALAMDVRTSSLPIDVRVSGDEVYIKGSVESVEQIDVVQFIVAGVTGVRHVNVDELQLKEGAR
ncbi:MAG: BON domain-containing protein [Armatimonadota bacterium]